MPLALWYLHLAYSWFLFHFRTHQNIIKGKKKKSWNNKSNHKKYNHETNAMVFLLSNKHFPLNEHCILPGATCIKYVIEDVVIVYRCLNK